MGCEIYAHFEIKVDGEWLHYSQPRITRNYALFQKMAGVRGDEDINPIALPRGLPKDISKTVLLENKRRGCKGHSHSWLNAGEISEVIQFHKNETGDFLISGGEWGYLFKNSWEAFKDYRTDYPEEIDDIRLVFWFEN